MLQDNPFRARLCIPAGEGTYEAARAGRAIDGSPRLSDYFW
jgi:hypothetical protein